MDKSKDYYSILGVVPSSDFEVIKAVYKALALKYHPDRNKDNISKAGMRMAEINEAYDILSNPEKRRQYDFSRRGTSNQDTFEDGDASEESFNNLGEKIEKEWAVIEKYYPDIELAIKSLRKISTSLVVPYKLLLLETKKINERASIASKMIDEYLFTYFGGNKEIREFAKELLQGNNREAAKELNVAVRIFGKDINSSTVINKIKSEFNIGDDVKESSYSHDFKESSYSNTKVSQDSYEHLDVVAVIVAFAFILILLMLGMSYN